MGPGREIGRRLQRWLEEGSASGFSHQSLIGRMLDELGADTSLQAPLRDLAMRPLFLQSLRQDKTALRQSAALSLSQELSRTYAPAVLAELQDLLEAALAVSLPRQGAVASPPDPQPWPPQQRAGGSAAAQGLRGDPAGLAGSDAGAMGSPIAAARAGASLAPLAAWCGDTARALGPGMALAAAMALVLAWLGGELDRLGLDRWHAAPELVVLLLVLQALAAGPFRGWRRQAPLRLEQASDPHQLRRWLSAPWLHHRHGEAVLNGLMLLAILGHSPLPLGQLLLRYALTSLATTALGVAYARRRLQAGLWDGATGAVAALIALAAGLSLLQWRPVAFPVGPLELPAWVLLVVYGALQLGWVLPRLDPAESSAPLQRLLRSSWWWGTALGLGWALLTRAGELLGPLLSQLQQGGAG
ncbi:MAG: rhomboid family intramembrane serine protease [Vulcanococcus sp.]